MATRPDQPNHTVAQVDSHVTDSYKEGLAAVASIGRHRPRDYTDILINMHRHTTRSVIYDTTWWRFADYSGNS